MKRYMVGVYADGTERVLTSLRERHGLVAVEDAADYLARNYGVHFARLWCVARAGRWRSRGVRWLAGDTLVAKPAEAGTATTWVRYCQDALAASEGDAVLAELAQVSFTNKERELWVCTTGTMR